MENKKEYYSESLRKIISEYITQDAYGEFTPFIEEIFQRRAYEFDFSDEEMQNQIIDFTNNVISIKFVPKQEMKNEKYKGTYVHSLSEIKLNQDFFLNSRKNPQQIGEEIFEILTHEVYHGINDYGIEAGLMYYDSENDQVRGIALDEVFIETAANRATVSRGREDKNKYRSQTSAYSEITFVPNLLAASIGVTEKEILSKGITDRTSFMNLFNSRFSTSEIAEKARIEILEPIETNLDVIYNLIYGCNDKFFKEMEKKLLIDSLSVLYNKFYELANFQIQHDERGASKKYAQELIFRFKKMDTILEDSLNDFKNYAKLSLEEVKQIKNKIVTQKRKMVMKTTGIMMLEEYGDIIDEDEEYERCESEVKEGKVAYIRNLLREKYGITPRNIEVRKIMEAEDILYRSYIMQEDFDNGLQWENGFISERLLNLLNRQISNQNTDKDKKDSNLKSRNLSDSDKMSAIASDKINNTGFFQNIKNKISNWFRRLNKNKFLLSDNKEKSESEDFSQKRNGNFDKYIVSQNELSALQKSNKDNNSHDKKNTRATNDEKGIEYES